MFYFFYEIILQSNVKFIAIPLHFLLSCDKLWLAFYYSTFCNFMYFYLFYIIARMKCVTGGACASRGEVHSTWQTIGTGWHFI